jgi:hypothetical protein
MKFDFAESPTRRVGESFFDYEYIREFEAKIETARKVVYTDKKENKIFLINKEIQSGAVAKSYMRKGFLIYEEITVRDL